LERFTVEVRDEATVQTLRGNAAAHGRSVEEELGRLVERTYGKRADDDWVHELIAMTRPGVEIEFPSRNIDERPVPFAYDDFD